ncbi:LysR substrate binding domain protein [compost metagenome]
MDRFLRNMHFTLREVCELDELEAIIKLVENGVGVALVPQTTHQEWPNGVRVLDLGQHTFHRDIGLVHRSRQSFTEPVRILAQLISDQVKAGSE